MYQRSSIKLCWADCSSQDCYHIFLVEKAASSLQHDQAQNAHSNQDFSEEQKIHSGLEMTDVAYILWSACYRVKLEAVYPDTAPLHLLPSHN